MKGKQKILMAFSEVAPFSKTGGLGDVGGGLPKALKEMGHDVRVITPQYRIVNERKYILRDVIRLQNIIVPLGKENLKINVKSAFLPNSKVQVYFIDYKNFFFRKDLYGDPKTGKDYPDNDKRFILFNRGILETLKKLQWQPDVIHCNDWQTGLIPFLLKTIYKDDLFYQNISSLFSIHNFAFQGSFNRSCVSDVGLNGDFQLADNGIELNDRCNFLKAGIVYSDIINTVSESYSKEVMSSNEYGFGMEEIVKSRKCDFYTVLNGIDYSVWNPEEDQIIPKNYSSRDLSGKLELKKILLEQHHLGYKEDVPVLIMISRLTDQKGLDLIQACFKEMMKLNIYFILLGVGASKYHQFFEKAKKTYKGKIGINLNFNNQLAHLMTAGADIILIPSRYEPCGLTQLYGLKYGTVPLVRRTGGLADTILPYDGKTGKGTGFVFHQSDVSSFINTLRSALDLYMDKKNWIRLIKNGMRKNFSWHSSAKKYVQLYQKCMNKK